MPIELTHRVVRSGRIMTMATRSENCWVRQTMGDPRGIPSYDLFGHCVLDSEAQVLVFSPGSAVKCDLDPHSTASAAGLVKAMGSLGNSWFVEYVGSRGNSLLAFLAKLCRGSTDQFHQWRDSLESYESVHWEDPSRTTDDLPLTLGVEGGVNSNRGVVRVRAINERMAHGQWLSGCRVPAEHRPFRTRKAGLSVERVS